MNPTPIVMVSSVVNARDSNVILSALDAGGTAAVPEPAAVGLLASGAVLPLRRRRR